MEQMKTRSQSKKEEDGEGMKETNKTNEGRKSLMKPTKGKKKKVNLDKNNEGSSEKVEGRKPPKFSWVIEEVLAGHGRPAQHGHIQYLCDHNINILITLTENKPRAVHEYPGEGLSWVHLPVKDENPPSVEQAIEFTDIVDKARAEGKRVSVHCAWGRGRTGTLMACYLAKDKDLTSTEAIKYIRTLRPGSIDTPQQEQTVHEYVGTLKQ